MLLNVVFAGSAYPPTHWSFLQAPSDPNFCDDTFLEEENTNRRKKRKQKSDHYSLRNRENEKHNFAGGPVREGGNASLVVGVTRAVYVHAHPRIYAFRFRDFKGCRGPIFVLKVAK